jgi:hypothetical protein
MIESVDGPFVRADDIREVLNLLEAFVCATDKPLVTHILKGLQVR